MLTSGHLCLFKSNPESHKQGVLNQKIPPWYVKNVYSEHLICRHCTGTWNRSIHRPNLISALRVELGLIPSMIEGCIWTMFTPQRFWSVISATSAHTISFSWTTIHTHTPMPNYNAIIVMLYWAERGLDRASKKALRLNRLSMWQVWQIFCFNIVSQDSYGQ